MSYRQIKVLELVDFEKEPPLSISDWLTTTRQLLAGGARPVSVFSQRTNEDDRVWIALASASTDRLCLTNTVFGARDRRTYDALSYGISDMNYFECELYEQTGIEPERHPWLRPVRTGSAWRRGGEPYSFYSVRGEEVHEVGVGPVHAGVIEPGHFRFQCHGEDILHKLRSEEHTSELQSHSDLVCRLLLAK